MLETAARCLMMASFFGSGAAAATCGVRRPRQLLLPRGAEPQGQGHAMDTMGATSSVAAAVPRLNRELRDTPFLLNLPTPPRTCSAPPHGHQRGWRLKWDVLPHALDRRAAA
jgi:hypothetical protein